MTENATILDHIGNTPLLKLNHVSDAAGVEIFVKCEFTNPGGSIKDRMALCMIEEAEKRGDLKPGGTIVDQSTGNTGPGIVTLTAWLRHGRCFSVSGCARYPTVVTAFHRSSSSMPSGSIAVSR